MKESKNVLQFMCYKAPYGGNFLRSISKLEQRLNKENLEMVYLFETDTSKIGWVQDLIKENKNVYFLSGNFFKDVFMVRKLLIKHDIRFIHTHFTAAKYHFLFKIAKSLYARKLYIVMHLRNHYTHQSFIKKSVKKLATHVDLYIGCSESVAVDFKKTQKVEDGKVAFVTNAIGFNRLDKYDQIKREDLQISPDSTVFLMFGFDYLRKGVDLVLEAMNNITNSKRDATLLISLSSNKEYVTQQIVERFGKLPSWLRILDAREDIGTYYKFSDCFISASREEGFCCALVEAAYCEIPIITSDIPGPGYFNIPHIYKFRSGDISELQNQMESVMSLTEADEKQMVIEEKAYVSRTFNLDEWANKVYSLYADLA